MCSVRLIMSEPETANINTRGWSYHGPMWVISNQRWLPMAPFAAALATMMTSSSEPGGGGVPSKYRTDSAICIPQCKPVREMEAADH
jgi:hypothetical protein